MPLEIFPVVLVRGLPVVVAPAEIDIGNSEMLRAALLGAAGRGHATVVVDMRTTEFCDTAGLGVLVRAHKRAVAEGGDVRLVVASSVVLRVLALTGLDQALRLFGTLEEAIAELPAVVIEPARNDRSQPNPMVWLASG
jgi:anti-sigma B factor antagonist